MRAIREAKVKLTREVARTKNNVQIGDGKNGVYRDIWFILLNHLQSYKNKKYSNKIENGLRHKTETSHL